MVTNNAINLKTAGIVTYNGTGIFSALSVPLSVSNAGLGVSSLTPYCLICGGTSTTNPVQQPAIGNAGEVFVSNGASALGSFKKYMGYALRVNGEPGNPQNGITYWFADGSSYDAITSNNIAITRTYIPTDGTIDVCYGKFTATSSGSADNVTVALRLNDTTDYNVSTTIALNTAQVPFSNTSLGISVTAGDFIEIKMICPTWSVLPGNVSFCITMLVTP